MAMVDARLGRSPVSRRACTSRWRHRRSRLRGGSGHARDWGDLMTALRATFLAASFLTCLAVLVYGVSAR